jgi:hypothetical protein
VSRDDPNASRGHPLRHGYYVGIDHFAELTGRPFRNALTARPKA